MTPILDADALEVWGDEPTSSDVPPFSSFDANRYSLESPFAPGKPDPLAVSVWDISGELPATALWSVADIAGIVFMASGVSLDSQDINVDGMMTNGDSIIIFTIDPAVPLDGGEIFVGTRAGGPGTAITSGVFLLHGGHLWDTAFPVASTFKLANENVDALEAVSVPEPSSLALSALSLLGVIANARHRPKRVHVGLDAERVGTLGQIYPA